MNNNFELLKILSYFYELKANKSDNNKKNRSKSIHKFVIRQNEFNLVV